jgi:hypothetical protein
MELCHSLCKTDEGEDDAVANGVQREKSCRWGWAAAYNKNTKFDALLRFQRTKQCVFGLVDIAYKGLNYEENCTKLTTQKKLEHTHIHI